MHQNDNSGWDDFDQKSDKHRKKKPKRKELLSNFNQRPKREYSRGKAKNEFQRQLKEDIGLDEMEDEEYEY